MKNLRPIRECINELSSASAKESTKDNSKAPDKKLRRKVVHASVFGALPVIGLFLLINTCAAPAQPRLDEFYIYESWPQILLGYWVDCHGELLWPKSTHLYQVFENGKEQTTFEVQCRDMSDRYSLSLAMVLDESMHMQAQGIAEAKHQASAMLSILNWSKDEASIRSFRESTSLYQGMATVEDPLRRLLPMLRDSGKAMLFDAVYAGILDVAANGSKEKKAVLVLSNGRDDGSIQSLNSCIARARAAGIHVFTVGLGPDIRDSSLRVLADSTQAAYFSGTNSGIMVGIYDALTTWLTSDGRCWIIYETACMDGENRMVDLVVRDTCGGSARASGSYRTPLDLSIPLLTTRIERATTWERQRVNIPIQIDASELGDTIQPFRTTILFMDALLQLDTVVAPKGSLLEAVPFVFTRIPGGVEVKTIVPVPVTGHALPAKLADLRFTVLSASLRDTLRCPLVFSSWIFDSGCYRTARANGEVVILPSGPTSVSAMPGADAQMDIYPEPNSGSFTVRLRLDAPQAITMRVRNVLGQIVHESSRIATEGEQNFEVQLGSVPKGVYLLEANIGSRRFVKNITALK